MCVPVVRKVVRTYVHGWVITAGSPRNQLLPLHASIEHAIFGGSDALTSSLADVHKQLSLVELSN